jgi:hypothetical protein
MNAFEGLPWIHALEDVSGHRSQNDDPPLAKCSSQLLFANMIRRFGNEPAFFSRMPAVEASIEMRHVSSNP